MGGVFVLAIYAYSELVYLIFICIAIVGLTIYYRKSIIKMYAEIFNELGINKYVIQTWVQVINATFKEKD